MGKNLDDIPREILVVIGENVVLLGEIDLGKESDTPLWHIPLKKS